MLTARITCYKSRNMTYFAFVTHTHIHHMYNIHVSYILRTNSDNLPKQHLSTDFVMETAMKV